MNQKKGDLPFGAVTLLALAVLVLVAVSLFYTAAFKTLSGKTTSFTGTSLANTSGSGKVANCNMQCASLGGCDRDALVRFQESGCRTISPCEQERKCVAVKCDGIIHGMIIDGIMC